MPKALDFVFDRALDPDPAKRLPSAGQLAQALEAAFAARTT